VAINLTRKFTFLQVKAILQDEKRPRRAHKR